MKLTTTNLIGCGDFRGNYEEVEKSSPGIKYPSNGIYGTNIILFLSMDIHSAVLKMPKQKKEIVKTRKTSYLPFSINSYV